MRVLLDLTILSARTKENPTVTRMKYYQCPVSQTMGIKAYTQDCGVPVGCENSASLKPIRSVRFPNDIIFQDYVRHGELERIGCFIRARRVSLDTIYHSGQSP